MIAISLTRNLITSINSVTLLFRYSTSYVLPNIKNKPILLCDNHHYSDILKFNKISVRYMAGHAKWQNIKHVKAEKDKQKSLINSKYVRLIGFAVREKGPNPKSNQKLASLLEEAKKHNITKDTLEKAMSISGKKIKSGSMEIAAPGGCLVIIEYESGNESSTRHDIKIICKKYNAIYLSGEGRWRACFQQKGIITACKELSGEQLSEERALDSAIEAGAEEVHLKENEEGNNYLEFVCAPDDLHRVKKEVEKLYDIEEFYIGFIPTSTVQLNDEDMESVNNFLEEIGNVQEVVRIYENVQ